MLHVPLEFPRSSHPAVPLAKLGSPLQTVAVGSTFLAATCNVAHASGSSPPLLHSFVFPNEWKFVHGGKVLPAGQHERRQLCPGNKRCSVVEEREQEFTRAEWQPTRRVGRD